LNLLVLSLGDLVRMLRCSSQATGKIYQEAALMTGIHGIAEII
jgi:hypothetical protein